jgi:hypothetical protein
MLGSETENAECQFKLAGPNGKSPLDPAGYQTGAMVKNQGNVLQAAFRASEPGQGDLFLPVREGRLRAAGDLRRLSRGGYAHGDLGGQP